MAPPSPHQITNNINKRTSSTISDSTTQAPTIVKASTADQGNLKPAFKKSKIENTVVSYVDILILAKEYLQSNENKYPAEFNFDKFVGYLDSTRNKRKNEIVEITRLFTSDFESLFILFADLKAQINDRNS